MPLNRVVAFIGPYISILSGIVSVWLTTHLHVLATFHINQSSVAGTLTQGGIFGVSALVTWLGHSKWLTGHQIELAAQVAGWNQAGEVAKGLAGSPPPGTPSARR